MVLALIISILVIITMFFFIIKKPKISILKTEIQTFWIVPLFGVLLIFLFGLLNIKEAFLGLTKNDSINPLKILLLFFSMTFMSIVLDEVGFFSYLANLSLKKAKNNQMFLFVTLYIFISVLTVFTSNDIIILTFTPFIIFFTKNAKINPLPYLVSEFIAANTWSMMFIIGNPTNIYLASSANISFLEYLSVMFLPTVFSGITSFVICLIIFSKELRKPLAIIEREAKVRDKVLLISALSLLGICTILLVISSYIGLEMYLIAFSIAMVLLIILIINGIIRKSKTVLRESFARLPWALIPFVISMFLIVLMLEKYEITKMLKEILKTKDVIYTYGITSTLFCNLVNNIPMSVLFTKVISNSSLEAIYATIVGSNIGAFLSPIGALAGIMWLSILKKYDINYSFLKFMGYGLIAIPTLLSALFALSLVV